MRARLLPSALIRVTLAALAVGLGSAAGAGVASAHAAAGAARHVTPGYVPHEVLVGYRPKSTATATADFGLEMGVRRSSPAPAPRSALLHLPPGESVKQAIARLRHKPGVSYAEPNFIAHATGSFFPDDRGRSNRPQGWERTQWNMMPGTGVDAPGAWGNLIAAHRAGGRGVVIAVLDTGVAYRNWRKFRVSPDFRGTRFVHPYDFIANNKYPLDRNGHGSLVAGIIAEATDNNLALTGLAYGASIMPVRILDANGLGAESTIAHGIRYAVKHGAQVINLSLEFLPSQVTSASEIPQIVSAINFAHSHGVTVVGAAGNDQTNRIAYPARAHNVISVGATTKDQCLADYSNGGSGLDLVAPGGGDDAAMPTDPHCHPGRSLPSIYQLTLTDPPHWGRFGYPNFYVGTSMSAPEVAATAALVIASRVIGRKPTPAQILGRLEQTATQLGLTKPNAQYGFGLLNAAAATSPIVPAGTPPSG
jgi:serine protease